MGIWMKRRIGTRRYINWISFYTKDYLVTKVIIT